MKKLKKMSNEDIGDCFDNNNQLIANYIGEQIRQEKSISKVTCTQSCLYQNDCPCDWNFNECRKINI